MLLFTTKFRCFTSNFNFNKEIYVYKKCRSQCLQFAMWQIIHQAHNFLPLRHWETSWELKVSLKFCQIENRLQEISFVIWTQLLIPGESRFFISFKSIRGLWVQIPAIFDPKFPANWLYHWTIFRLSVLKLRMSDYHINYKEPWQQRLRHLERQEPKSLVQKENKRLPGIEKRPHKTRTQN